MAAFNTLGSYNGSATTDEYNWPNLPSGPQNRTGLLVVGANLVSIADPADFSSVGYLLTSDGTDLTTWATTDSADTVRKQGLNGPGMWKTV